MPRTRKAKFYLISAGTIVNAWYHENLAVLKAEMERRKRGEDRKVTLTQIQFWDRKHLTYKALERHFVEIEYTGELEDDPAIVAVRVTSI